MASSSLSQKAYSVSETDGGFIFTTDYEAEYLIYFAEGDGYAPNTSFADGVKMFGFQRTKRQNPKLFRGTDGRIAPTVSDVLLRYFSLHPEAVILYVCSQSGGSEKNRSEMFEGWFNDCQTVEDAFFEKVDYNIVESGFYSSCIFHRDHPCRLEIYSAIQAKIEEKR